MKAFYEQDANLDFLKNKTIPVKVAESIRRSSQGSRFLACFQTGVEK